MCEAAAEVLHNTPAICRKSYVHPAVLALSEPHQKIPRARENAKTIPALRAEEAHFVRFLKWVEKRKAGSPMKQASDLSF